MLAFKASLLVRAAGRCAGWSAAATWNIWQSWLAPAVILLGTSSSVLLQYSDCHLSSASRWDCFSCLTTVCWPAQPRNLRLRTFGTDWKVSQYSRTRAAGPRVSCPACNNTTLLNLIRLPHLKRCCVTSCLGYEMRRWGLLWPALSQSSRSRRTIWLASYGLFCHPAAASANSSYNSKHCLCGWYMFVRASNEGSRRLRKDFTITEKVPTWAFSWLKPPK